MMLKQLLLVALVALIVMVTTATTVNGVSSTREIGREAVKARFKRAQLLDIFTHLFNVDGLVYFFSLLTW